MTFCDYLNLLKEYGLITKGGTPSNYRCPLDSNTHRSARINPEQVQELDTALAKAQRLNIDTVPFIEYYVYGLSVSRIAERHQLTRQRTSQQIERTEYFIFGLLN